MNKRADIPVMLLVIGVFSVCTLAILSFSVFSYKNEFNKVGISVIEDVKSIEEQIKFYENNNINFESLLNAEKDISGVFDLKIKKDSEGYIIVEKYEPLKNGLMFKVEYSFKINQE